MKREKGNVYFGNTNMKFSIIRSKRRRTVSIFVDPIEGVFLRVPIKASFNSLSKLVHSRAAWILNKQRLINETVGIIPKREYVTGESFLYLGKHLRLKITKVDKKNKPKVLMKGGRFVVNLNGHTSRTYRAKIIKDMLNNWYKHHARGILHKRSEIYSQRLGVTKPKIFLANQTKRWGSCNKKEEIRFNWHIIMAPVSLVDYVVAHELCHLKYKNHSENFWKLVGRIMPDYEARRERLRKEGPKYIF